MDITKLTAKKIGEHQLNSAYLAWLNGDYIAAITLAGAADEILGKKVREGGNKSSYDDIKDEILNTMKDVGANDKEINHVQKIVHQMLNLTRNELKHTSHGGELEFNLKDDAIEMLERAVANFYKLNGSYPDWIMDYWATIQNSS